MSPNPIEDALSSPLLPQSQSYKHHNLRNRLRSIGPWSYVGMLERAEKMSLYNTSALLSLSR